MYTGLGAPNSNDPPHVLQSPDLSLSQLRGQIKKVMIPLLIRVFELKLSSQQAKSPPSRLERKPGESLEELCIQLRQIDDDVKQLHLWCVSCQKQIERALREAESDPEEPQTNRFTPSTCSPPLHKFLESVNKL